MKDLLKEHKEFSKILLIQESALVWVVTISFILLAFLCIFKGYTGSLPFLTGLVSCVWAAYGVSQACYYGKSKAENILKIQNNIPPIQEDYTIDEEPVDESMINLDDEI